MKVTIYLDNLLNENTNYQDVLLMYLKSIFASTYEADFKMCLAGMLATDVLTLDAALPAGGLCAKEGGRRPRSAALDRW